MKKITFLITLLLLCLVAFPQQYFSKGFVSNGDGNFLSGTKLQLGGYYIRHNTDSVWLEKPLGTWIAPISNPATVVIDTLTKIATKYDLDTLSKSILDSTKLVTKADLRNGNNLGSQIALLAEAGSERYTHVEFFPVTSTLRLGIQASDVGDEIGYKLDSVGLSANHDYRALNTTNDRWIPDKEYVDDAIGGVSITETDPIYAADSNTLVRWPDTTSIIATKADLVETVETASRTIYVSTTGDDEEGDGTTLIAAFRNILRALQDIKPIVQNSTITISLNGTGDFPMTYGEMYELGKKTFINSELTFTGVDKTTIESGYTLAKTASRCFAYTLTKAGLTATENQYRGNFASVSSTEFYPIAYNEAGTNSFEIEFTHNSKTTATSIISWGANLTNPSSLPYIFDIDFGVNVNSNITFNNLNIIGGTSVTITMQTCKSKTFNNVVFNIYRMQIGSTSNYYSPTINFKNSVFNSVQSSTSLLWLYNINSKILFTNNVFNGQNLTSGFFLFFNSTANFQAGNYIYGKTSLFAFGGRTYWTYIRDYLEFRDISSVFLPYFNCNMYAINSNNGSTSPYYEFINVTNLLNTKPLTGSVLQIGNIYGSLPANLINGVTSGYIFVDPKNNIYISAPGIYGEFETPATTALADNSTGAITVGDITQNESVKIEYKINRGTSEEVGTIVMTKKADTNLSDISYFDDCGVSFTKTLVSNAITLNWATTSTGTAATIKYSITRIML